MNAESIRKVVKAQPFQPFNILTVDGRKFHVPHPDFILVPPGRMTYVVVAHPDGTAEHVNTLVISSLAFGRNGRNGRRKAD